MDPIHTRLHTTGPIELRSFADSGRRLGTPADCVDGSKWELHRGELVEQMGSHEPYGMAVVILRALVRAHARPGMTVLSDAYCDLTDVMGESQRAADVVLVGDLAKTNDAPYRGVPILAVEVRGTQSRRYLEEKVALYLEHAWPCIWIAHAERQELEVIRPGVAAVVYRLGSEVPLVPELDRYGLRAVPVKALFDQAEVAAFNEEWARELDDEQRRPLGLEPGRAVLRAALRRVLAERGLAPQPEDEARISDCRDLGRLERWLDQAAGAPSVEEALR